MKTSINGITVGFEDCGSGPCVVLVHGFPLNRHMWEPQVHRLAAAGYRVITPDLRGFGESDATAETTMQSYSDDIIALLDHLGVTDAVIGGMSMGGYVVLDLLSRHPQRCIAPLFIVTKSGADDEAGKARRLHLVQELSHHGPHIIADAFANLLFRDLEECEPALVEKVRQWMVGTRPEGLAAALLAMRERQDYTPILEGVTARALVIGAAEDKAIPPEFSRQLAERLPDAELCMIPGGGHLVNMEKPEEFNACLLRFLQQARN